MKKTERRAKGSRMHHGIGVIITNTERSQFLLQQKDNTYPFKEFRNCYAFFGGEVNPHERTRTALRRELQEELEPLVEQTISNAVIRLFSRDVPNKYGKYHFTLYEAVLPTPLMRQFATQPVYEGRWMSRVSRADFARLPLIHNLEMVRNEYIRRLIVAQQRT